MQTIMTQNGCETTGPVKAQVTGALPMWLKGTLLRNGPGCFSVGDSSYNHWFDGMSLIHSFTFSKGEVVYRSKFLKSETHKRNMAANRIVVSEFGTMIYPDPCKNIFSRAFTHLRNAIPDFTDNNLINVIRYGDQYYAASEVNYINQIDPATLDTLGRTNYRDHIALNLATAHPHYDDEGNTYNMGTAILGWTTPRYVIFKVPAQTTEAARRRPPLEQLQKVCSIPCRSSLAPGYFHSFGMTGRYLVFVEQPFKLHIPQLASAYFRGANWGSCLKFHPDDQTVFHLIDRHTGKEVATRYYGDAMVVFHHINAYEEGGVVVVDLISYSDSNLYQMFYLDNLRQETPDYVKTNQGFSPPTCKRFLLPLSVDKDVATGTNLLTDSRAEARLQKDGSVFCTPEVLFQGLELPAINYKFNGKKYRYFYGSRMEWSPHPNKLAKVDLETGTHLEWEEANCFPSEPVFVASPDAVAEDDGVVLSCVVSADPALSPFLLVLDAHTWKEVGRAAVDARVHIDLHGLFIPAGP
ncbi:beta,beta-carotene 15,15'-dioxygenase isoform X1 [Gadus macrocephalus]|uniref:beta,beta-carotene 15,15'-dioxygenase isoform X1 n=2 Tax=Gadus macrocephalus TaxID=80720 RepID=UPI0028CB2158|nr:beta,beta-carotene 15,15'-dioxygenase isoform X1 [Gadus macrocephalus]